jgi:hypothetical protein
LVWNGNEVAPTDLGRVHADLGGEQVDRALDGRGGLGSPGAAVGADRGGVGEREPESGLHLGDVVDAGGHQAGQAGQERADAPVGTGILDDIDAVRQDAAVAVSADLDVLELGAALGHADQVLAACLGPAQGPADLAGRPGHYDRVSVDADLGPEPAAHVGHDHTDLVRSHAQRPSEDEPTQLRVLRAMPHGQLAARVAGRGGPALHRQAGDALVDDVLLDDHLARLERGVVLRHRRGGRDVGPRRGKQQRLVGHRSGRADHGDQRVIVHADQVGGVLALVAAVGNDHRDRLAHVPDGVHRQQRFGPHAAERHRCLADSVTGVGRRRGQVVHVANGQDGDHAGLAEGLAGVDAGDPRVGHRAAHEGQAGRRGQFRRPQVIHVDAARGQQPRILGPDDPGAHDAQ